MLCKVIFPTLIFKQLPGGKQELIPSRIEWCVC